MTRDDPHDIVKLGGSTELSVPHYDGMPVGFVAGNGKPKGCLQFSTKKKAYT